MKSGNLLWVCGALASIAGCNSASVPNAQNDCDRACLGKALDSYLDAVIAHDPVKAPLAQGIRQTENALNVVPGKGVWQSVTALGKVQRRYFDPVTGQAGYYGTVMEGEESPIVTVRLRIENKAITEAEWYIARANDPGLGGPRQPGAAPANLHNPEYLADHPPPERTVPAGERVDRGTLGRIVDSYFDAITSHDGSIALTHKGCGRAENGHPAPGGDFLPPAPPRGNQPAPQGPPQQPGVGSRDCVTGLENFNLSMVVARRMPLIDEEAQTVLATGVFIRRPGSPTPRNVASWWFVIDGGKIRTTYTAMFYPPATLAVPNWPPYDGNWPLAESVVPAQAK
ncbi:MAG: hypothetical protein ABW136_01985 [Steroidobacteraceae bacterium]